MMQRNTTEQLQHKVGAKNNTSMAANFLGAAFAGSLEVGIFHAPDTAVKRLQKNKGTVTWGSWQPVVFKGAENASPFVKMRSLYSGILSAGGYKILQRTLKFGGQPLIDKFLDSELSDDMKKSLGSVGRKACAGAFAGMSEVVLLPLDAMKIKTQTGVFKDKGAKNYLKFVCKENIKLYDGSFATMARNAPGSFILFGTEAAVKQYVFKLQNFRDATLLQNITSSSAASIASVVGTLPIDVVKTRIQSSVKTDQAVANSHSSQPSFFKAITIAKDMLKTEGPTSFFKGVIPKVGMAAPKVAFAMTLAPYIAHAITDEVAKRQQLIQPDSIASGSHLPFFAVKSGSLSKLGSEEDKKIRHSPK
jgi:hypothetical protein